MPIVLVSGDARPDAALLPAGTRYLHKPPTLRGLVATVLQAIADWPIAGVAGKVASLSRE